MFWRFGGYANISTIDSILEKPDVTLEEVLDEQDLIQELKQNNAKLLDFIRDENNLDRLLQYVIAPKSDEDSTLDIEKDEPSGGALGWLGGKRRARSKSFGKEEDENKEDKQRLKYAYVACEILSADVWSIAVALIEQQESLRKFWEYLKQDEPLDNVQAGYFTKVNESLLDKATDQTLEFFKTLDNVVPDMLRHVDCPCVMDLLLKIISLERSEGGAGIVEWLQKQNLIPLLLDCLSPQQSSATQTSAGDFLKAIITISANATAQDTNVIGPNELTRQLVSEECVQALVDYMISGGNALTVGVGIIIEVIRKNNSDYDVENAQGPVPRSSDPIYLGTLLRKFAHNVPKFMSMMQSKNGADNKPRRELKVAFGDKIEPLGFDRFKTCELMAELLHCSNMALLNDRGAEAEVKKRDAERDRLKAEDASIQEKLQEETPDHAEFGTSVDSQGFHHARAPSISDDSPELVKRPEIINSTEEDFENVVAAEELGDEIKDDFDDTLPTAKEKAEVADTGSTDVTSKEQDPADPASKTEGGEDADSPTAAGLTERLGSVELDPDTIMKGMETSSETSKLNVPAVDNRELSPHPEDKPAPLFSGKKLSPSAQPTTTTDAPAEKTDTKPELSAEPGSTVDEGSVRSVVFGSEEDDSRTPFTVDVDGSPVVGDLLKIQFVENKVVPTILDFFFRFPWNNFLHNVVYDVVQQVFNGSMDRGYNRSLAIDLFETGRITDRIIEGQQASDKSQAENNMRLGYMGHLTLIAEEVVKFTERHPPELLSPSVLEKVMSQVWIEYVEQTLADTRERDNAILGGVRPDMAVGPRQAVLNAVNAASGFGGGSGLSSLSGNGAMGLDTADLTNASSGGGGATGGGTGGYLFSGSSLLSGFSQGSSDEEDEDMAEEQESRTDRGPLSPSEQHINPIIIHHEDDPPQPPHPDQPSTDDASAHPPPLNFQPPSRARRAFAARMAERQRAAAAAEAAEAADGFVGEDAEYGDNSGGAREGMDGEVQAEKQGDVDAEAEPEGEDVGIVMRKSGRAGAGAAAPGPAGTAAGVGLGALGLGKFGFGAGTAGAGEGSSGAGARDDELEEAFEALEIGGAK